MGRRHRADRGNHFPQVIEDLTQPPLSQAQINYEESFNEFPTELFKERIVLYHGELQYYYDVPTQTKECEYDGDGEQKSDTENSLYEESDNDGDTGDSDTNNSLYDEDNDAMLEDDNFNDNADTPESFTGCSKKQKKKKNNWEADIQVEDLNMDEKQYNSHELHSLLNSDEEGYGRRCKEFNVDTDMENPQFDQAIQKYGVLGSYECKIGKNDRIRLSAKCKQDCNWRLFASVMQGENTFQIKSYTPGHACSKGFSNKNITSTFLSERYMVRIKDDPKIKKTTLQSEIYRDLGYEVSTDQCYKSKRKAITLIEGTYAQQYEKLWEYCEEVRKTNIGGTMMMKVDPPYFQRLYVCLDACKQGFVSSCRPLIGSWCWFLQLLIDDLGPISERGWTFISDQQKGLDKAFQSVVPKASHRWCVRHLYGNFKQLFKGQALKDKLGGAAMASNEIDFNCEMEKLKELDEEAYKWLKKRDPNMRARHRFSSKLKCDMLLNNLCECFNSWILAARDKPILTMLEMIKCKIMRRLQVKRDLISKFEGPVCPKIQGKLEKNKTLSRRFRPVYCGNGVFQVGDSLVDQHLVNLTKTCSCKRWELNGIPSEEFVDQCYTPYAYLRAYYPVIYPIKGMKYWPKVKQTPVLPPRFHPPQNFVQPTITRGPRGGTFTTPNVSRTPITCQIETSLIGTKTSSQANWPPMPQIVLCSNMSRAREGTFIIPNVTRLPMPQTAPGTSMYMPSISRLSIQTTPSTSSTSTTSHSWKPPDKAVYTMNSTTSSKKKNI
ncbi:hypothetical protein D8674_031324 [Pyrus ussuriensis x Pyrus communis]|uniref:Transposase MuDR plant domain-containing protein n=1 Tax=Pyrus ussuriensis x Pyrus communis TaxID=2448454 RepID=A0A5N5FBJ0_9ROSA|nr:hypothetical protein D8674_031324 [Pyrus ussuriensis x Pyrus communis]